MAVLQDLGFPQSYFNFLDIYSNRAIKKEERKACLFDVDDLVNFPGDFPSATVKFEHVPPVCRPPTPYSQPYSFAAARPGSYLDPYFNRKFISFSLTFFVSNIVLKLSRENVRISGANALETQRARLLKVSRIVFPCFCLLPFVCSFF